MRKEKIRANKRTGKHKSQNNPLIPTLVVLGGIVLILWGAYTLWGSRQSNSAKIPIKVTGSPSLSADRELVDLGNVPVNRMVSVTFQLSNVGDKTLRFSSQPTIEVVEGC